MKKKHYPTVVIGAGAAGLVVALGLARANKRVLLIEKGHYGGDCTNFGCIPSKALIASADYAHNIKQANQMGIAIHDSSFNADNVLKNVREIVSDVRSHEDERALQKQGVETMTALAEFIDPYTLKAIDQNHQTWEFSADKIVIAAGSSPKIPPIQGLSDTPFLTNETIFDLKTIPRSLIIVGGGPIGSELAQAFSRLGSDVIVIHKHKNLLPKESLTASKILSQIFQKEGIKLYLGFEPIQVRHSSQIFQLDITNQEETKTIQGEKLLICVGRSPNLKSLHLEKANIQTSEKGILVDSYARSSQKHIFAIGDIVGAPFFTHLAENRARAVLTTLLLPFFFKKKIDIPQPIPRVTYTDPEIASIGLLENQAIEKFGIHKIATYQIPFSEVDRAIVQKREEGLIIVVTKKWSSQILGATIVGPRAGEMLGEISLAMHQKIPLRKLASLIHPYPTYLQATRKASDLWLTKTILSILTKRKRDVH